MKKFSELNFRISDFVGKIYLKMSAEKGQVENYTSFSLHDKLIYLGLYLNKGKLILDIQNPILGKDVTNITY